MEGRESSGDGRVTPKAKSTGGDLGNRRPRSARPGARRDTSYSRKRSEHAWRKSE